jgi:glycosyltransferase involved in cell wall biosynthesis
VGLFLFDTGIFKKEVNNTDPMKLKDYMVLGLTVIATDAISSKNEIKKNNCGIIIRFNKKELINAVVKLMTDEKMLKQYRENAVRYIERFDIEKIYGDNLSRILG